MTLHSFIMEELFPLIFNTYAATGLKTTGLRVLKFQNWVPYEKISNTYPFLFLNYAQIWSYTPFMKNEMNILLDVFGLWP